MNAQCIMVCSGKGGTGKSTVSVLLGACLARLGRKVLLVELDSGLRSVDIIAGVYGRTVYDIEDVLCGRCEGAKAVVPSPLYPGLSVISAPYEGGAVAAAPLGRLLVAVHSGFHRGGQSAAGADARSRRFARRQDRGRPTAGWFPPAECGAACHEPRPARELRQERRCG